MLSSEEAFGESTGDFDLNQSLVPKQQENEFSILRGSFSQNHFKWSRNKQSTAMATVACAYSFVVEPEMWTSSDIDMLLEEGEIYYQRCLEGLSDRPTHLEAHELLPTVSVGDVDLELDIQVDSVMGVLEENEVNNPDPRFCRSLEAALEHFFMAKTAGVLTCQTKISVAVFKCRGSYILFDSHAWGPKGHAAPKTGTSMVIKYESVMDLSKKLKFTLQTNKGLRRFQFSITAIDPVIITPRKTPRTLPSARAAEKKTGGNSRANLQNSAPGQEENGLCILRGSFGQHFFRQSRNKQCTAMAAGAAAYSFYKDPAMWTSADLDMLLESGDAYYQRCLEALSAIDGEKSPPILLAADELLQTVSVGDVHFDLDIQVEFVVGLLEADEDNIPDPLFHRSLQSGLEHFFASKTAGVVTCETRISVAVLKSGGFYFLFDSHACGPKGYPAFRTGTSMLLKLESVSDLVQRLKVSLQTNKRLNNFQYSITAIEPRSFYTDNGQRIA